MTSFLHFQVSLTGLQVPGGACRMAGETEGQKLVAPRGSFGSPVPTIFQKSVRLSGGTVANKGRETFANIAGGHASRGDSLGSVWQVAGRRGTTPARRGTGLASAPKLSGVSPSSLSLL
jgi:hypothetical protein